MRETATVKRLGTVRRRRRFEVKTSRRGRRTREVEEGEVPTTPTFLSQALTSREYKPSMLWCSGKEGLEVEDGREDGAPRPDAGLWGWHEEGDEGRRRRDAGGAGPLPPFSEPVSASGNNFPRMLRQVTVGDLVDGGLPGCGPEAIWMDQWTIQGWAGPLASVYFCLSCQLGGGLWRK